jgi:hypothetical protein
VKEALEELHEYVLAEEMIIRVREEEAKRS